jgi:hypothetical protein
MGLAVRLERSRISEESASRILISALGSLAGSYDA